MADRYIEVSLARRGIAATAKLLDESAPITCAAVWDSLPLAGDVYHAKYARNEIYALLPPFAASEPPPENPTVTPIPGDLCYFSFAGAELGTRAYGYDREVRAGATVVEDPEAMAEACNDLWRTGAAGETLSFRRT
ncbi:DUF3830 family protein [Streptomyces bobili]|uniref:DUF3830 family protein n=1 Tax=Streptomyces bobili TaxID=67280 RepID=UPI003669AF1B